MQYGLRIVGSVRQNHESRSPVMRTQRAGGARRSAADSVFWWGSGGQFSELWFLFRVALKSQQGASGHCRSLTDGSQGEPGAGLETEAFPGCCVALGESQTYQAFLFVKKDFIVFRPCFSLESGDNDTFEIIVGLGT